MYYVPAVWLASEQGGIAVRNVLFVGNDAPAGIPPVLLSRVQTGGDAVVFNNVTVAANGAVSGMAGVEFDIEGPLSIANSVFWGNPNADLAIAQNSGSITLANNDIGTRTGSAPTTEAGTLAVDPQFVSANDRRLQADSPLRDAGDSAAPGGVGSTDLDGMPRIALGSVDIGAYEVPDDRLFGDGFEAAQGAASSPLRH
jgi:hypothetical protein